MLLSGHHRNKTMEWVLSFEQWLKGLSSSENLPPAVGQIIRVIARQPERASYATARDLAAMAGVDVSTVTRAAQATGYAGWPELRSELRAQYLRSLSLTEIAVRHGQTAASTSAMTRSIDADRRALALLHPSQSTMTAIVNALANAENRAATGGGTYGAAAQVFASHCGLIGYPTAHLVDGAPLANGLVHLGEGDVLVALGLWRPYRSTSAAAQVAADRGAKVCVITDVAESPLTEHADHVVLVSSEGGALPTMVAALAVANAILAELAERDTERTSASIAESEETWTAMQLLFPKM